MEMIKNRWLYFFVLGMAVCALSAIAVEEVVAVSEGTVKKLDAAGKKIVIAAKDGTEHTFVFVRGTAVHGFELVDRAAKDSLNGVKEGSEVVVHYTSKGGVDTAEEIDHVGDGGLKIVEGTVKGIDRGAKTITITTADGSERTFRLLERAARDSGMDLNAATDRTARVLVYYSDESGKQVAHFFKSTL